MATEVRFFCDHKTSEPHWLPRPACCLSRHSLDALMVDQFQDLGGVVNLGERIRERELGPGWVDARGRVASHQRGRWVGVSFHLEDYSLQADLEMHLHGGSYVGLCRVERNRTNVCALLSAKHLPSELAKRPIAAVGACFPVSLPRRLSEARLVPESFVSVASLDYAAPPTGLPCRLALGDAQGLIPPITGNGMSLALESAALAAAPVVAWSRGERDWRWVCQEIQLRRQQRFSRRLRVARALQELLVSERSWVASLLTTRLTSLLLPVVFRLTR